MVRTATGPASRAELELALQLASRGELRTDMGMDDALLSLLDRVVLTGVLEPETVREARRLRDEMESHDQAGG